MAIAWVEITTTVLCVALTWIMIFIPVHRCNRQRALRRWQEAYREHQMEAITQLHPAFIEHRYLQRLTWEEIERTYSVQELYNQIR